MKLQTVVSELGIEKYPPLMESIFEDESVDFESEALLDEAFIREVSKKYDVLREREEEFLRFTALVKQDKAAVAWLNGCNKYFELIGINVEQAKKLTMPKKAKTDTTLDIFPMLVLLPQIEKSFKGYVNRGLSEDEALYYVRAFGNSFSINSKRFDKTCLVYGHFQWLCNYYGSRIINVAGFNFEVKKFEFNGVYIKNKKSGQLIALMLNEKIHKSGLVLGTPGAKDAEGMWCAPYKETEDEFIGYAVSENGLAVNEERHFPKSEWEKILEKGDDCISFHIPTGADFTSQNLDKAFKEGIAAVRKYYPEKNIRCVTCASWLVSPQLWEIMKPTSNIVAFGKRFTPLPQVNSADSVFTTVFPKPVDNYNDLPEETSLQRSMKKLYLDGGYLYTYIGAFEINDD